MKPTGVNMTNVKQINRSSVLQLLLRNGSMSRTDLAGELNLTTATLTSICSDFIQKGLLVQNGSSQSQSLGRKKCPLEINSSYKYIVAVNLHYTKHIIAITDLRCKPIAVTPFSIDEPYDAEHFFKTLANSCIRLLWENSIACEQVLGACVCIVGSVNQDEGISLNPFSIFKEKQVPIRDLLEKELPFPVCVENNVCAFLNSEIMFGRTGDTSTITLKWGPGVGSASSIGGRICKNKSYHSAEIGHTYFYPNSNQVCKCGRKGCLETGVNLNRIMDKIFELLPSSQALQGLQELYGPPDIANIHEYLNAECPALQEFLDSCIHDLAIAISNAIQVFSPDRVILFGILFEVPHVQQKFVRDVIKINPFVSEDLFCESSVKWQKEYIGPAATAIKTFLIEASGEM